MPLARFEGDARGRLHEEKSERPEMAVQVDPDSESYSRSDFSRAGVFVIVDHNR